MGQPMIDRETNLVAKSAKNLAIEWTSRTINQMIGRRAIDHVIDPEIHKTAQPICQTQNEAQPTMVDPIGAS